MRVKTIWLVAMIDCSFLVTPFASAQSDDDAAMAQETPHQTPKASRYYRMP